MPLPPSNPESPHDFTDCFHRATRDFYEVAGAVYERLDDEGKDIESLPRLVVWSDIAREGIHQSREKFSTPEQKLRGALLELTAQTPLAFMMMHLLARKENADRAQQQKAKYLISSFSQRIRRVGELQPTMPARRLVGHMVETLTKSDITPHAPYYEGDFARLVRGAQHELAAGQILRCLGEVRPATTDEDLTFVDYVMKYDGTTFAIDIKSSPESVIREGAHPDILGAISSGRIVMYSHIANEELGGGFAIPPELAEKRSIEVRTILDRYKNDHLLRNVFY